MSTPPPPYQDHDAPYPGQPAGGWDTPAVRAQSKGFFTALFDFSFTNFVTLSFAKFIYVLALILIGIFWVVAVLAGFSQGFGQGLLALILGSLGALFYVVLVRVGLEFSVAMVRTAQNTSDLVARR